jgi:CheY-like chemotaxis protein
MNVSAISPTSVPKTVPGQPSILCVDDSEEILLICRTVLEAEGYQVFTAASAPAALELLHMHSVNAAVIDNVMPGMSGIALAREIKRVASDVRVILFSSLERPDESVPFIDSYLSKGQGPIALRKLIGLLLKK